MLMQSRKAGSVGLGIEINANIGGTKSARAA